MAEVAAPEVTPSTNVDTSLEDRIAAKFGVPDDNLPGDAPESTDAEQGAAPEDSKTEDGQPADKPEPDAAEQDSAEEVEYEGKQYKVPRPLKDALLRQADYSRKTAEVAEMRKSSEVMLQQANAIAALQQQNAALFGQITNIDQTLKSYEGVDWNRLSDENPAEASKMFIAFQRAKDQRQAAWGELMQKANEQKAKFQEFQSQKIAEAQKLLAKEIKDWGEPLKEAILKSGLEYGFSADELGSIVDARQIKLLNDARQFRELQKARPAIEKRAVEAPKVLKPTGATGLTGKQAQIAELRSAIRSAKTESDKAKAVEQLLVAKMR